MASLGDFFPDNLKNSMTERSVKTGSVISLFDREADKIKRHLIVGIDNGRILLASVRINSEINTNVYRTEFLKSFCYEVKADENNFLDHDSFIACDNIMEWKVENLQNIVAEDPQVLLGEVDEANLEVIKLIIGTSKTITPKQKKRYDL